MVWSYLSKSDNERVLTMNARGENPRLAEDFEDKKMLDVGKYLKMLKSSSNEENSREAERFEDKKMLAGSSRHLHEIAAFCTQHGSLDCTHLEQSAVLVKHSNSLEQSTMHNHII